MYLSVYLGGTFDREDEFPVTVPLPKWLCAKLSANSYRTVLSNINQKKNPEKKHKIRQDSLVGCEKRRKRTLKGKEK